MDQIPDQYKCNFTANEIRVLKEEFGCTVVKDYMVEKETERAPGVKETIRIYKCMSAMVQIDDLDEITKRLEGDEPDLSDLGLKEGYFAENAIVVDGKHYAGNAIIATDFNDLVQQIINLPVFKLAA